MKNNSEVNFEFVFQHSPVNPLDLKTTQQAVGAFLTHGISIDQPASTNPRLGSPSLEAKP